MRGKNMPMIPVLEEIAHRVAWAAVKKVYVKVGSDWVLR